MRTAAKNIVVLNVAKDAHVLHIYQYRNVKRHNVQQSVYICMLCIYIYSFCRYFPKQEERQHGSVI